MRTIFTTLAICFFFNFIKAQTTYNFTGSVQYYVVPACVDSVIVDAIGAEGGTGSIGCSSNTASPGGRGGRVEAKIPVTPGDTLYVYVGGKGEDDDNTTAALGGWNGGGEGAIETQYTYYGGGGGGGASDIRLNDTTLTDRIVVAGGGGGAGADGCNCDDLYGGAGGGLTGGAGEPGALCNCDPSGQGGTQSAGGVKGDWACNCNAQDGTLGQGGMSNTTSCGGPAGAGGGGGGYYGGGGGGLGGGGGGSSYTSPNATNVVHTQGFQTGDGMVVITPIGGLVLSATVLPSDTVCEGDMVTLSGTGADTYVWDNGVTDGVPFLADSSLTYKMVGNDTTAGCSDSITVDLFVMPAPDASFSHTNTGLSYSFTNTEAGGVSWEWDFGDGDTSNLQNPNHVFSEEGQFVVCLTVTDTNGCSSTSCDTIDAEYPLGVNDQKGADEFILYPNPAKNILNITLNTDQDILGIEVYSMKGKLVFSEKEINQNRYSLRTAELSSGRYMLKIIATDKVTTKKFTINK